MFKTWEALSLWIVLILAAITISLFLNVFIGVMFLIGSLIVLVFYIRRTNDTKVIPGNNQSISVRYECISCGMLINEKRKECICGSRSFKAVF